MTIEQALKLATSLSTLKQACEGKLKKEITSMTIWQKIAAFVKMVFTTNAWMSNVQFLAFMAHSAWFAVALLAVGMFSGYSYATLGIFSLAMVLLAACKEFIYDHFWEVPVQTNADDWQDFIGYVSGLALAWALVLIHTL